MADTDKMTAGEFAEWTLGQCFGLGIGTAKSERVAAIESRDRYREARALEAAADRTRALWDVMGFIPTVSWDKLRDAILGKPAFVKGQLVRCLVENGTILPYDDELRRLGWEFEPVKVRIDEAGRAIVEDE